MDKLIPFNFFLQLRYKQGVGIWISFIGIRWTGVFSSYHYFALSYLMNTIKILWFFFSGQCYFQIQSIFFFSDSVMHPSIVCFSLPLSTSWGLSIFLTRNIVNRKHLTLRSKIDQASSIALNFRFWHKTALNIVMYRLLTLLLTRGKEF